MNFSGKQKKKERERERYSLEIKTLQSKNGNKQVNLTQEHGYKNPNKI